MNDYEMDDDKEKIKDGYFSHLYWARGITGAKVKLRDLSKRIVILIDYGSKINVIAQNVYDKGKWPIDIGHGWALRIVNNQKDEPYGTYLAIKMTIEDVKVEKKICSE